jgi:hypothetical protein
MTVKALVALGWVSESCKVVERGDPNGNHRR